MTQMRPNVIFILADDMGYGDFGRFNNGLTQTPALDQLASEGMCFSQHYSASPVCAPARAGLLTGRYPHRTGVIDTYECLGLERLALRERTLADLFQQAGYVTGLIGKWHCGTLGDAYHPNALAADRHWRQKRAGKGVSQCDLVCIRFRETLADGSGGVLCLGAVQEQGAPPGLNSR